MDLSSPMVVGKYLRMTQRQAFAISKILTDLNDTETLKAFAKTIVNDAGRFGTILMTDRCDGELRWHVSVSALSEMFKPISWDELKPSHREAVRQLARELLKDVGRPDTDFDLADEKSYQLIRQLTVEEERQISAYNPV
jgi:hypothetical protein